MVAGTFRSSPYGILIHLAENVCGPVAQNVVRSKEFTRGRQQAKGRRCTEGRRRSENIRFVIGFRYGKVKAPPCHFVACWSRQQPGAGAPGRSRVAGGGGGCVELAKQSLRKRPGRRAVRHGRRHFSQQSLRHFDLSCRKCLRAGGPECGVQ